MKTVLIAFACVSVLAACKDEVPAPVTTAPAVVVPADTMTATPAATMAPATQNTEMAPATATTPASGSGSSGSSVAGATEGSGDGIYVVGKGDTLWDIAEKNGINHGDLAKWNNVNDPRELQVGRKLSLTAP